MNAFKRYALALLAIYALVGAAIYWFGFTTPQYLGDLTRLGGYREDEFGWQAPQQRYRPPLFTPDHYDADTQVLILGDSMTVHRPTEQTDPGVYWPNVLAAQTGWKIAALHRREHTVEDVLARADYQAHPPRLFVLEIAERTVTALERITETAARRYGCGAPPAPRQPVLEIRPLQATPEDFARPQPPRAWLDLSLGGHRLKHLLLRQFAPGSIDALHYRLTREDLFSNRRASELLVFRDDLEKLGLPARFLAQQACALQALQQEVEAGGRTRFVLLMVPDKLSAYRPYVRDFPAGDYPPVIAALAANPNLLMPRLDLDFEAALRAGTRDLYLPDDTHLGSAGHRLVAERLLAQLRASGLAAP